MGKNNNNRFNNRAAKRFRDLRKVDQMSQEEVFKILEADVTVILQQYSDFRNRVQGSSFPDYMVTAFGNISTPLFFYRYVKKNVKVKKKGKIRTNLSDNELEALRFMLADIYKKSATNHYATQVKELPDRNNLLAKTFIILCPDIYNELKVLYPKDKTLTKVQKKKRQLNRRDLVIQLYGDPVYNMKFIHGKINSSPVSDKKKLKLLRKVYGKQRFVEAVGAAMTVESSGSDLIHTLYDYMASKKKRKRAPYVKAYADAYKINKSSYFRINEEFFDASKPLIKELIDLDLGYKKAFDSTKPAKKPKSDKPHELNTKYAPW